MFKKTITAILFIALGITETNAEPRKSVNWLMNTPASLFDIGMMRMRLENSNSWIPELIEKTKGENVRVKDLFSNGGIVYSWEEDTITVSVTLIGNPTEKTCSSILAKYKDIIFPPVLIKIPNYTMMDVYFSHVNYSSTTRPKTLNKDLDKMVVLSVGITENKGLSNGKAIFCSSTLNSNTPSFQKFGL